MFSYYYFSGLFGKRKFPRHVLTIRLYKFDRFGQKKTRKILQVLFFHMIMKENEWRILYKWHSYDIMRHLKKVKNSLLENLFSLYTSPHPCLPFYEDCICTYISRWKVTSLFLNLIFIKKICFSLFSWSALTSRFNSFFNLGSIIFDYWQSRLHNLLMI